MPADRRHRTRVESRHVQLTAASGGLFRPRRGRARDVPGPGGTIAARWIGTLALAGSLSLAGCLAAGPEGGRPSTGGGTADITREELDRDAYGDAYRAIQRLRRTWLRQGARTAYHSNNRPVLYVNGIRMEVRELSGISDDHVERISLLSPIDATTRFGTDHASGAIMIVTRRAPPD